MSRLKPNPHLTVCLVGFKLSDVTVEEDRGIVTVRGSKEDTKEDKDRFGNIVRKERSYQSFMRR